MFPTFPVLTLVTWTIAAPVPVAHSPEFKMDAVLSHIAWKAEPSPDFPAAVAYFDPESSLLTMRGLGAARPMGPIDFSEMSFVVRAPLEPGTIQLGGTAPSSAAFRESLVRPSWISDASPGGVLIIDRVDVATGLLQGRFEFVAASAEDGSVLEVKAGVFTCRLHVYSTGKPVSSETHG